MTDIIRVFILYCRTWLRVIKKIHDKIIKIINNEKKNLYNSMKDKFIISKTEKINLYKIFNNCN